MKPLRLAVDTNVLLDLAGEVDDVLDAVAVISLRLPDTDKLVLPSVLEELAFLADSGRTKEACLLSAKAIRQIRDERRFRPLLELPYSSAQVVELADELRRCNLLPEEEMHDAEQTSSVPPPKSMTRA
ncbi:MAG: hypothetical protein FJ398_06360 [Verrucomicrobia bacterium]|nr:hypothetical protein [Verrucomicrobiota bacterium]